MPASFESCSNTFNRKALLKLLGLAGGGFLAVNCGGGGSAGSSVTPGTASTATSAASASASATAAATASAAATATASSATAASCAETLEAEVGPYFTDDSPATYNRSTITSNLDGSTTQAGVPLTLTIFVRDSKNSCAAMSGVQVDIWHCNALGVYSNESVENTVGQSWLRGYQLTNAAGSVTFTTIVPGWYSGRTPHVHLRLRSTYNQGAGTSDGTDTTQLFFPQTLVDTIDTTVAPYSSHGKSDTTNAGDHVYTGEVQGTTLLSLSGSTSAGYSASYTIDLPIDD